MTQEAMKLALDALGEIEWSNNSQWQSDRAKVAINALREALEQPAQQELVTWMEMVVANLVREGVNKHKARELAQHFYTSPQPAQRKPLTERELMKCITQAKCFDTVKMTYESGPYEIDRLTLKAFEFARAIEAAHGIKGEA